MSSEHQGQHEKLQQQIQQMELVVRQHLTSDALSRLGNVKVSNPQLAIQLIIYLGQRIQSGKVGMIDDAQFKAMLQQLSTPRREFKITRK